MCDNLKEYKLCTCADNIDKTKPYWILCKAITSDPSERFTNMIMGELIPPDPAQRKKMLDFEISNQKLLLDLNSKNVFDFNYQPLENDVLKIVNGEDSYYFLYEKSKSNYRWIDAFDEEKFLLFQKKIGFIEGEL